MLNDTYIKDSFYSEENYKFHPYRDNDQRMDKEFQIKAHSLNIIENGQIDAILLFEDNHDNNKLKTIGNYSVIR